MVKTKNLIGSILNMLEFREKNVIVKFQFYLFWGFMLRSKTR